MKRKKREDDLPELYRKSRNNREKWVKHYSCSHKILLVGDGDFSFSLSLFLSFGFASNIWATSLDSYETLTNMYKEARSNLEQLRAMGATLLHGVDATKMNNDIRFRLNNTEFDRIVFNFPHAGFYGKEGNPHMIQMHQDLLRGFFSNARLLLHHRGEIHVTHKNSAPYCHWNLNELAQENRLRLLERVPFNIEDYPHYHNKRGHGSAIDEPFKLGDCSTFKFVALPNFSTNMFNYYSTNQMVSRDKLSYETIQNHTNQMVSRDKLSYETIQNHTNQMVSRDKLSYETIQNQTNQMVSRDKLSYETLQNQTNQMVSRDKLSYETIQNQTTRQLSNTCHVIQIRQQEEAQCSQIIQIQVPQFRFIVKGLVRLYPIPGAAGYAGALINSENTAVASIFGPLVHSNSDFAELGAIKQALFMFERSKLCGRAPIVIESDSRFAVSWIQSDIGNPWEVQPVVKEIRMAMSRIRNADIRSSFIDHRVERYHHMVNEWAMIGCHRKSAVELWH